MELLHSRCAGLDVHKKLIVACVRVVNGGRIERVKKRFGATTAELMRLHEWLTSHGVTHMSRWKRPESSGSPSGTCPTALSWCS